MPNELIVRLQAMQMMMFNVLELILIIIGGIACAVLLVMLGGMALAFVFILRALPATRRRCAVNDRKKIERRRVRCTNARANYKSSLHRFQR